MSTVNPFKRSQRTAVKLKVLLMGPSGAGKTLGGLRLAEGIAADSIALIDSENDRSGYYADVLPFDSMALSSHKPSDYIAAVDAAVAAGYKVVVIDSLAHAWQNVLDRKTAYEKANPKANSYTTWGTFGMEWEKLIRHLLDTDVHIIATARSKQAYEQVTGQDGRKKVEKLGMQPQLRDGAEYEFALVFDIQPSHKATCTKDNTGMFDTDAMQMWDLCDGSVSSMLRTWLTTAKPAPKKVTADSMTLADAEAYTVRGRRVGDLDDVKLKACLAWAKGEGDALAVKACEIVQGDREDEAASASTYDAVALVNALFTKEVAA